MNSTINVIITKVVGAEGRRNGKDMPEHIGVVEIRSDAGYLEWKTKAKVPKHWEMAGAARHRKKHRSQTLSSAMGRWYAFRSVIT